MKHLCVIGDPIEHSLSPTMHNAAIQALGLQNEYVYEKETVRLGELEKFLEGMRGNDIVGLGVTMPHKERIVSLLDEISDDAKLAGSVNVVVKKDGKLHGHTTDGEGIVRALDASGSWVQAKDVLLIGAGGAARPIAISLANAGVGKLAILNRDASKAKMVSDLVGGWPRYGGLDNMKGALANADIVINATSVGMQSQESIVPAELLRKEMTVVDLVYNPLETKLLSDAKAVKAKTIGGASVLLHQGDTQFELFTGKKPPLDAMKKAMEERLGGKI